ncbi:MAG: MATE family efflux transporter [Sarcina sp.]
MEGNLTDDILIKEEDNILGTERISKLFLKFVIPAIIAMVITGMQTVVDGIFIGNFVGANAMASISMASPFLQITIGVGMLISIGAISYMGRSLGEGKIELTQNIFRTSTIILGVVSVALSIAGIFFSKQIVSLLGANEVLATDVATYIKILAIFILPMSMAFLFGFINRLVEKPELFFKGMIVSLIINIILNYVLIGKLGLGVVGAAFATGISYSVVLFVVIGPMLNKNNVINIFVGKFDKKTIWPVIYNGASEAVASIAAAVSAFLFNMAFINFIGENGIAAFTSINYVAQFGSFIVFGIADGIGSIISYNYGAKKIERVKKIMSFSLKITVVVSIVTFIILFFFSKPLVSIFIASEKEVLDIAVDGSKIYAFAFLLNGINTMCSSYFTSIGYAKESIIIAMARGLLFIILGINFLPILFDLDGVWLTVPFAEFMTFGICCFLINRYIKKSKTLERLEPKIN